LSSVSKAASALSILAAGGGGFAQQWTQQVDHFVRGFRLAAKPLRSAWL
jgi:hypothetical protein